MTTSGESTQGTDMRRSLPRRQLGRFLVPSDRDPLAILEDQHRSRLQALIGVRVGRMLQSPFAYYRGTAAVMAADLAASPVTGARVLSCGDAHISNFGFFASPERTLLFDLNDFDEAGIAPWEWDVRRLATSLHIGARENGLSEEDCREAVITAAESYRAALRMASDSTATQRYFAQVDSEELAGRLSNRARKITEKATRKARGRTSSQVLGKIATRDDDGRLSIVDQPPITRHVDHAQIADIQELFEQYLTTLREDASYLLQQFRAVDFVLRIVGVGSVGTRCYVVALEGPAGEVLFLQPKEAQPSVLSTYGNMPAIIPGRPTSTDHSEGHRVVAAQRILQAQSDPFLGHIVGYAGELGKHKRVDYYWRQFRDMKGSIEPSTLPRAEFIEYGALCGQLLARAHSQSPAASLVARYLGKSQTAAEAMADWARAYADLNEQDFARLEKAVTAGRFPVEYND